MWRAILVVLVLGHAAAADQLSGDDLARKNDGNYATAVPLAAYSVDFGFGAGARAYYYWNGTRDDPRFSTTPYLVRVFLNVFATTEGLQYHWLDLDAPKIFSSPYRLRAQLIFERNINSNYFGFSDAGRGALHFPGATQTFSSYDTYAAALRDVAGGEAYTKYDQYDLMRPAVIATIERTLLDDRLRVLAGIAASYARIHDYTGDQVDATAADGSATTAPMARTRLAEDCAKGILVGCTGGRDAALRLGVSYDTRDFEPDPNRGIAAELSVELGTEALGSEFNFARALVSVRGYYSPFPELADFVLAGRVIGQLQSSGTPFFDMDVLPFIEDPRTGLGGHRTLRGFRQSRFVDHAMAASSGELRWTFARTTVWRQKLAFIAVPFLDLGRAFDGLAEVSPSDWRAGYGGAFRVSWNLATLGTFEYGRSAEGDGVYVNFGHMF
jgi:outer membrane protein assembly factor BamA